MEKDFLDIMAEVSSCKKIEGSLPIARKAHTITPLLVGDDLALRTSMVSPSSYDREMIKLLHKHVEFIEGEKTYKESYENFCRTVSNIDKISMIYSMYKCSYDTLGNRTITCPKCTSDDEESFTFKLDVTLEDLIHNDTFALWSEDIPFYEYVYNIDVEYEQFKFTFKTLLPNISRYNSVLSMVTTAELQNNLEKIGQIFTKPMQMVLLTKEINIQKDGEDIASTNSLQEVMMAFENHIPDAISEQFYTKYNDKFSKYLLNFYKPVQCPKCNHSFNYKVDIESEFFRRVLSS